MSTNLETLILRDETGNRPAAGIPGRLFYDTTLEKWQRDSGADWEDCEPAAGGGGDMTKAVYDTDADDVVDEAAAVEGVDAAGNSKYYGTNESGTPGFYDISSGSGESSYETAYYERKAALLEPDAIEPFQFGTFSYVVAADEVKYLLASWATRLGASGRMEIRDPSKPLPLKGVTLTGLSGAGADPTAVFLDPSLPTYTNAREKYYERLSYLATTAPSYLPVPTGITIFLPGPYGVIVTRVVNYSHAWIGGFMHSDGWNFANEVNDTTAQRIDNALMLALNKRVINEIWGSGGSGQNGGIVYHILPSTWSVIEDATSYDFRDDFMGDALDTVSDWSRTVSTAGNIEINVNYHWCLAKATSNNTWGQNGIISQASISRAAGKVFMCDIYMGRTGTHGIVVGFHDGAGVSYTDFSHGIMFVGDGNIKIFENGTDRGATGSHAVGCTYRVRITLGESNDAAYEIQGGTAYEPIGSDTWDDITPGTTSSATATLYAGIVPGFPGNAYISDVKIY